MNWIDEQYISRISTCLQKFKKVREHLYNFRCPFCGDSSRSKTKTRGYLYRNSASHDYFFKCHNCSHGTTFARFLKHLDVSLYNEYCFDRWKSGQDGHSNYPKPKSLTSFSFSKPVFEKRRLIDELLDRMDTLPREHFAVQYIESRQIPQDKWNRIYFLDDTQKIGNLSEKYREQITDTEPRIVFPFFDRTGKLIGFAARFIGTKSAGLRYLTIKISDGMNVFGLEYLNPNKHIYITEGAIDSLFLSNAVSCSSSSLTQFASTFPKKQCTIIWDNEPRNLEIVRTMQKGIDDGFSLCIWPDSIAQKDINEMVLAGKTVEEIQSTIDQNTCTGIEANFRLNFWRKC